MRTLAVGTVSLAALVVFIATTGTPRKTAAPVQDSKPANPEPVQNNSKQTNPKPSAPDLPKE